MSFVCDDKRDVFFGAMAHHSLTASDLRIVQYQKANVLERHTVFAFVFLDDQLSKFYPKMRFRGDLYRSANHQTTDLERRVALFCILHFLMS